MIELVIFDMAGTTVKDERYVDAVRSQYMEQDSINGLKCIHV